MIIARMYPIERADNIGGEKFAEWLVKMSGVYDDVIALAIETGVVPALGALPDDNRRRCCPKQTYMPYDALDVLSLPQHTGNVPHTQRERPKEETKLPFKVYHAVTYTSFRLPLWRHPDDTSSGVSVATDYAEHHTVQTGESVIQKTNRGLQQMYKFGHLKANPKNRIRGPRIKVEAVAVGPPDLIKTTFPHLANSGSVEVFQTEVMGLIVDFLWGKVRGYYVRQYYQYCCLLCFFIGGMYANLFLEEHQSTYGKMSLQKAFTHPTLPGASLLLGSRACLFLSFIIALLFLLRELKQARKRNMASYFSDSWNLLELFGYGTVIATNIWLAFVLPWSNIVGCVSVMILTTTTMAHLRGFGRYSPIITTFIQIVSDMRSFIVIVILLWVGGTVAFKCLFPHREAFEGFEGFWSTWQMVLGDVMPVSVRYEDADMWRDND